MKLAWRIGAIAWCAFLTLIAAISLVMGYYGGALDAMAAIGGLVFVAVGGALSVLSMAVVLGWREYRREVTRYENEERARHLGTG